MLPSMPPPNGQYSGQQGAQSARPPSVSLQRAGYMPPDVETQIIPTTDAPPSPIPMHRGDEKTFRLWMRVGMIGGVALLAVPLALLGVALLSHKSIAAHVAGPTATSVVAPTMTPALAPTATATTAAVAPPLKPTATPIPACVPFTDALIGGLGSRWQFVNLRGDAEIGFGSSGLSMTTPPFHDLWATKNEDGPRVITVAHVSGNFTVQVTVNVSMTQHYQGAGIFIWENSENFLRLENAWDSSTDNIIGYYQEVNNSPGGVVPTAPTIQGAKVTLRIQRAGNQFTAAYNTGSGWQTVGTATVGFGKVQVGVDSINQPATGAGTPTLTSTFTSFSLSC
jgi:regulation of enolase protein 1 (concanavalin A-like superfamily)